MISLLASAQTVNVSGKVTEEGSGQPVPFCTLYFVQAKTGAVCDENGIFSLSSPFKPDSLRVSAMGFEAKTVFVSASSQGMAITLRQTASQLQQVQVIGYKDPGKALLKKVIARKPVNDPERLRSFGRNEYLKTRVDLSGLKQTGGRGTLQLAARIYERFASDSSSMGVLPLYFAEQYFQFYHAKTADTDIRTELARKTMNLATDQLGPKLDKFYIVPSIYDAVIPILKTSFIGPVSNIGLGFYHYQIIDTLAAEPHRTFKVSFAPKSPGENTFTGTLWIEDDTYALKKVIMHTSPDVNLNFIQSMRIEQLYQQLPYPENATAAGRGNIAVPDSVWMLAVNNTAITFQHGLQLLGLPVSEDTTGKKMILTCKGVFSGFELNGAKPTPQSSAQDTGKELEPSERLTPLSADEQAIYATVDSLRTNNAFNRNIKLATLLASGYWDFANRLRLGPLSSIVSSNYVEGLRIRTRVWTLEGFNKQINLNGYLAYGLRDGRWKGGMGIKYVPSRAPYRKTEIFWRKDYDLLTENDDELDMDNIFTLGLRKNLPAYQIFTNQFKLLHERDLNHNWSARLVAAYKQMSPTFDFSYAASEAAPQIQHTVSTSEAGINLRYGHNERTTIFNYDKIRIYTRSPVLNLGFVHGFKMFPGSDFAYNKVNVGISQEFNMPLKGSFYYNLSAGKVFGTLPYILLHNPRGNPYYVSSRYAFNNMRPFEFSADRYASLMVRYSMGGLILDHLPLLQKFNIRERLLAGLYWGDMSAANKHLNRFNPAQTTGKTPYAEAGFGFENIFNVLSIDAVWRRNYNGLNPSGRFGIFTGFKIVF